MTEQQWRDECQANYEKVTNELIDDGYTRSKRNDVYKAQFVKDSQVLVLTRSFSSSNWYVKELMLC